MATKLTTEEFITKAVEIHGKWCKALLAKMLS